MKYLIRKKEQKDCFGVAHVVTVAWNETYKGIVPDASLEELKSNEDERAQKSFEYYDANNNYQFVLEINNEIVGFVHFGITKDEEFEKCGEILALYIIKKYQGYGFGKKLVDEAVKELKKMGCDKMIIACLKGNPSNEFYKHIGGKYIKDGIYKRLNLEENIYFYENI